MNGNQRDNRNEKSEWKVIRDVVDRGECTYGNKTKAGVYIFL